MMTTVVFDRRDVMQSIAGGERRIARRVGGNSWSVACWNVVSSRVVEETNATLLPPGQRFTREDEDHSDQSIVAAGTRKVI
jgi:hypothetical protein